MNRFPFTCHLRISNRHLFLLRPHSRREEHWQYYSTTPTGLGFSGLHQKTPEQLPRQVSPGSVFCIAPQFAFLPQIFRATGSAAQNQRALHGSVIRAPPFPKQYAQRESPWIFSPPIFFFLWIMLPSLHEQGNWGHFELLIFLSRTYGDRHVSSGHAERARSCQQISLFIFPFCFFYEGAGSSLATSYTFQFVRLGDKDAFGDVGSVAFQRRKYESLWKWGRRGTPFLHLSSSRHQQLLQRLTEQTSAETRANRQKQTG